MRRCIRNLDHSGLQRLSRGRVVGAAAGRGGGPEGRAVPFVICHLFAPEAGSLDHVDGDKYESHGRKIEGARAKRQLGSRIWEERAVGGGEARTFGGVGQQSGGGHST